MSSTPDLYVLALAAGVIGLFGWYFWHVAARFVGTSRLFSTYLDSRAERQRAQIEMENRFGKPPLWLRAVRALMIAIIVCGAVALLWYKL